MSLGSPKVQVSVAEVSNLNNPLSAGPICVKGPTARGVVDDPSDVIRNRLDFLNKFGGRIAGSEFPTYCLRLLDAGCQLRISRTGHYADITDKTTLEGTKASATVSEVTTPEVLGTASGNISAAGGDGDSVQLTSDEGSGVVVISTYIKQTGDDEDAVATGLMGNLIGGYTGVAAGGATGNYTITAPIGSGADSSTYTLAIIVTGTLVGTVDATFAGGANEVTNNNTYQATAVGAGYNGMTITVAAAASNVVGNVDITTLAPDQENTNVVSNVSATLANAQAIADLNALLVDVQLTGTAPLTLATGTASFTAGVQDISAIVDQDYIGNKTEQIGWFSFDNVEDSFRIANIDKPSPDVDIALSNYVQPIPAGRGDMKAHIGTPLGITPQGAQDYRKGEGIYSHTPIDAWWTMLVSGDESINDPDDSTKTIVVPGIVEYLALKYVSDVNRRVWLSTAGTQGDNVGVVKQQNNGVDSFNFASKGYKDAWDSAYENGVNALIQNPKNQLVYFGNRTLNADTSKLLSKDTTSDLCLYIKANLEEILPDYLFKPLDARFFKDVYQGVLPFIDSLVAGRAIVQGEGSGWQWIGDQDADTLLDAQYNTQNDLNQGIYRFRFIFIPIGAVEYIIGEIRATSSGSFSFSVTEQSA